MKCTKCGDDFVPTPKQRRKICKPCMRAYNNAYYAANKDRRERIRESNQARIDRHIAEIQEYKKDKGCTLCPESEPICLDFHHLDPSKKGASVSKLVTHGYPMPRIWEEINKCVVLCSNCHRKVHAGILQLP